MCEGSGAAVVRHDFCRIQTARKLYGELKVDGRLRERIGADFVEKGEQVAAPRLVVRGWCVGTREVERCRARGGVSDCNADARLAESLLPQQYICMSAAARARREPGATTLRRTGVMLHTADEYSSICTMYVFALSACSKLWVPVADELSSESCNFVNVSSPLESAATASMRAERSATYRGYAFVTLSEDSSIETSAMSTFARKSWHGLLIKRMRAGKSNCQQDSHKVATETYKKKLTWFGACVGLIGE